MLAKTIAATAVFTMFSTLPALAQGVTDYLGVPGHITVGGTDYVLSWSSNPSAGYYKQEYLPAGAVPETYESMVMVEFLATDKVIIFAWVSDENSLRAYGSKSDAYNVFKGMLGDGYPPGDWEALNKQASDLKAVARLEKASPSKS